MGGTAPPLIPRHRRAWYNRRGESKPVRGLEEPSMPLHDWDEACGWDGVRHFWITHLFHWVKPRLPADYWVYVGSVPALSVTGAAERRDVAVRHWLPEPASEPPGVQGATEDASLDEPVVETATLTLDPQGALYVMYRGRLAAAVELVSPRNKDRPAPATFTCAATQAISRKGPICCSWTYTAGR
jgi:hypothetical protein